MELDTSRPTLYALGILEVESNVCDDSAKNRKILTDAGIGFKMISPGFIEVDLYDMEMGESSKSTLEKIKPILTNPKNPWSDFLPLDELPLDYLEHAPAWLIRLKNEYEDGIKKGLPVAKLPYLPGRCERNRADGSRCAAWAWRYEKADGYCRFHAPVSTFEEANMYTKTIEAAKARLFDLQPAALSALEELVLDKTTVPHVRLKAAENILDRTGLGAKQQLEVTGTVEHTGIDPAEAIRQRLNLLADRAAKAIELEDPRIIEAEIVETDD